jgi:hypothetical protein
MVAQAGKPRLSSKVTNIGANTADTAADTAAGGPARARQATMDGPAAAG